MIKMEGNFKKRKFLKVLKTFNMEIGAIAPDEQMLHISYFQ